MPLFGYCVEEDDDDDEFRISNQTFFYLLNQPPSSIKDQQSGKEKIWQILLINRIIHLLLLPGKIER